MGIVLWAYSGGYLGNVRGTANATTIPKKIIQYSEGFIANDSIVGINSNIIAHHKIVRI